MQFRQAIETKYIGPTDTRGSRVRAFCAAKSMTFPWRSEWSSDENHEHAAVSLFNKLGWNKQGKLMAGLVGGTIKNGNHVFVSVQWFNDGRIEGWK